MKIKRIVIVNVIMAAFLAVNVGLLMFPLGLVYVLLAVFYRYAKVKVIIWFILAASGIAAFIKMYKGEPPSQVLAAMGFIGAVIGANTVYREYDDKEFLYIAASFMTWLFLITPAVISYIVFNTNIYWIPSV